MPDKYFAAQPPVEEILRRIDGFGGWFEIDLDGLVANLDALRECAGVEVMPVVKNNAYGHGLRPVASELVRSGVTWLMVAKLGEALAITSWDMPCHVVNMDMLYTADQFYQVVENDITQVIYTHDLAQQLSDAAMAVGRTAGVFVKIDTGLHRVGVDHNQAIELIRKIAAMPGLEILGTFSTMMQDDDQDKLIVERFQRVLDQMDAEGIDPGMRSLASSHGIFHGMESLFDMTRPAIALYGIYPSDRERESGLELQQVLTFKARIEELKPVAKGETVTYFGKYTATRDTQVATLHVGFYDALPRELTNRAQVLAGGQLCSGIGSVSLNHCLFDATDVDVQIGDVVEVISKTGDNDIASTAATAGWMVYSLLNHLCPFVPRVYFKGGVPVALHETAI